MLQPWDSSRLSSLLSSSLPAALAACLLRALLPTAARTRPHLTSPASHPPTRHPGPRVPPPRPPPAAASRRRPPARPRRGRRPRHAVPPLALPADPPFGFEEPEYPPGRRLEGEDCRFRHEPRAAAELPQQPRHVGGGDPGLVRCGARRRPGGGCVWVEAEAGRKRVGGVVSWDSCSGQTRGTYPPLLGSITLFFPAGWPRRCSAASG